MQVTYIDHCGDDLTVVNAARVSFDKQHSEFDEVKDTKLIKYLARHNHWTPFSHVTVTCRVKAPIFIARQLFKHKVGFSENEISRRYVDQDPEFFMPEIWRKKAVNKKQGSSSEAVDEPLHQRINSNDSRTTEEAVERFYEYALDLYRDLLDNETCPEQARMVLPQAMYTEWYWTGSLAAWARVYNLRSHESSQREHLELTDKIDVIMQDIAPVSWEALTNGQTPDSGNDSKGPASTSGGRFGSWVQTLRTKFRNGL